VPVCRGVTVQEPPCAFATASTIASPSPTPPVARDRTSSPRAKRSKIRSSASGAIPDPCVRDLDYEPEVEDARADLDRVVRFGVLHSVLEQRIERDAQGFFVRSHVSGNERSEPPGSGRDLRPADEDLFEKGISLDVGRSEELRLLGLSE